MVDEKCDLRHDWEPSSSRQAMWSMPLTMNQQRTAEAEGARRAHPARTANEADRPSTIESPPP
eukprot:4908657-Prymnesium_polylepis.1